MTDDGLHNPSAEHPPDDVGGAPPRGVLARALCLVLLALGGVLIAWGLLVRVDVPFRGLVIVALALLGCGLSLIGLTKRQCGVKLSLRIVIVLVAILLSITVLLIHQSTSAEVSRDDDKLSIRLRNDVARGVRGLHTMSWALLYVAASVAMLPRGPRDRSTTSDRLPESE